MGMGFRERSDACIASPIPTDLLLACLTRNIYLYRVVWLCFEVDFNAAINDRITMIQRHLQLDTDIATANKPKVCCHTLPVITMSC
jgi:hypothetical protein